MFTLLDYDASRYILNTLAPRVHRVLSGGIKTNVVKTSRDDSDLHPRSQSTLTQTRSAQGHGLVRVTSMSTVPHTWTLKARSPLSLFKRTFWGSSKGTPSGSSTCKDSGPERLPGTLGGVPGPLQECTAVQNSVDSFRNARKFIEIPGPTAMYQTVPFASTRLLYFPFSQEKVEDRGSMLNKLQSKHGPIMRVRLGSQWVVFIETLSDIQTVVSAYEREQRNRSTSLTTLPIPRNISPLDKVMKYSKDPALEWLDAGSKPQRQRNAVSRYLDPLILQQYQTCQEAIANDFIRQLDKILHNPQDIHILCHRYALENSAQLCFRQRMGLLGDHYPTDGSKQKLVESYKMVVRCLGEILTGTRLIYTLFEDPFAKRFREARAYVQGWERRQTRESMMSAVKKGEQAAQPADATLLIALMDDRTVGEEDISDILHTLMSTRSEASACALLMLLASLATNVEKQEKLAADILKLLGPDGPVKQDTLQNIPFLGACINESLRMHFPMSSGGQVILANNIVLSSFLIPAGMPIELNSRRAVKNPIWFEHPNFYLPERWMGSKAEKIPAAVFMPYGFSYTGCPGLQTFFFQEISAAVIKILQRYKLDLPEDYHNGLLKAVHTPFLTPKEPLPFTFTKRSAASPCTPCPPAAEKKGC